MMAVGLTQPPLVSWLVHSLSEEHPITYGPADWAVNQPSLVTQFPSRGNLEKGETRASLCWAPGWEVKGSVGLGGGFLPGGHPCRDSQLERKTEKWKKHTEKEKLGTGEVSQSEDRGGHFWPWTLCSRKSQSVENGTKRLIKRHKNQNSPRPRSISCLPFPSIAANKIISVAFFIFINKWCFSGTCIIWIPLGTPRMNHFMPFYLGCKKTLLNLTFIQGGISKIVE